MIHRVLFSNKKAKLKFKIYPTSYFQLYSTRAFATFLQKRHNYREPDFLKPILKIDRSPQKNLLRASKRALLAAGRGYVSTLGKGARKEIIEKEKEKAKNGAYGARRKSVVFKR